MTINVDLRDQKKQNQCWAWPKKEKSIANPKNKKEDNRWSCGWTLKGIVFECVNGASAFFLIFSKVKKNHVIKAIQMTSNPGNLLAIALPFWHFVWTVRLGWFSLASNTMSVLPTLIPVPPLSLPMPFRNWSVKVGKNDPLINQSASLSCPH